jgi:hypothetical protein
MITLTRKQKRNLVRAVAVAVIILTVLAFRVSPYLAVVLAGTGAYVTGRVQERVFMTKAQEHARSIAQRNRTLARQVEALQGKLDRKMSRNP